MAQPDSYERQYSFTDFAALHPTSPVPGGQIDVELNEIKQTLDQILDNLELIQRDDGDLANDSVGLDQLTTEVLVGFEVPQVWVTGHAYTTANTVFQGAGFYRCLVAHTAGVFATDLSALKWELIVNLAAIPLVAASQIAYTPTGGIAGTNVQAALTELDSEKAATSHTHPASAISDSTTAGRNMLTAANVAAQQTLLGLGSLAYLNSISVTAIPGELAYTGVISPAALGSNTNDWAPTGVATATVIRASASTSINLTGILAAAADGTLKVVHNVGTSFNITLTNQDTASAAANRFIFARAIVLRPSDAVTLMYDLTSARWRATQVVDAYPRGYIAGCILSNNSGDTANDIDVTAGVCRDSTNSFNIDLSALTGKQLDANWAPGSTAGMRNSGVAIANGTYHIYAVAKANGTADVYAHTSTTVATVLTALQAESGGSAYIYARLIGSIVRTAGASGIVQFMQVGDNFVFTTSVADVSGATSSTTGALKTLLQVPLGIKVLATMMLSASDGGGANAGLLVSSPDSTGTRDGAATDNCSLRVPASNVAGCTTEVRTDTSAQIFVDASTSSLTYSLRTFSYKHPRGKDD